MDSNKSLKDILAENLTHYRKTDGLTQLELAEKLNYSDKAVSKWERGESAPDIFVLAQIAEMYGITINDLLSQDKVTVKQRTRQFRVIVTLLSAGIVWLFTVLAFVVIKLIDIENSYAYLAFIYGIPASSVVVFVFASIWKKRLVSAFSVSVVVWGVLLSLYLSLAHAENIWLLFILGIPVQILIILWYMLKIDFRRLIKKRRAPEPSTVEEPPTEQI